MTPTDLLPLRVDAPSASSGSFMRSLPRLCLGFWIGLCLVLSASRGAAAPTRCEPMEGGSSALGEIDAQDRLAFVRTTLKREAERARVWRWSWITIGTALAAGNFARAGLADTAEDRVDPLVAGTASLFIPTLLLLRPPRVIQDAGAVDASGSSPSGGDASDLCVVLARAEGLLADSADAEALGAGPLAQAVVFGGNAAVGAFLGLGYRHWSSATILAAGGIFLGEIQIATQPVGAVAGRDAYLRGVLAAPRGPGLAWRLAPLLGAGVRGAVFQLAL